MSQFPEITSNLSTANFRASVLTILQAIYTNANTEAPAVTSGGITGTTSVTARSVTAYVVNTIDTATLGFSTTTTATSGTISIYGSVDGINYLPTSYAALASGNSSGTFNAATQTIGQINCVGLIAIAFKANAVTGGSVVVTTIGTNAVSNVMLDNALPSGTNVIGSISPTTGALVNYNGGVNPLAANTNNAIISGGLLRYLRIQNNSLAVIYCAFGTAATTANGIQIAASGGSLTFETNFIPNQSVNLLSVAGTAAWTAWAA